MSHKTECKRQPNKRSFHYVMPPLIKCTSSLDTVEATATVKLKIINNGDQCNTETRFGVWACQHIFLTILLFSIVCLGCEAVTVTADSDGPMWTDLNTNCQAVSALCGRPSSHPRRNQTSNRLLLVQGHVPRATVRFRRTWSSWPVLLLTESPPWRHTQSADLQNHLVRVEYSEI